MQFWIHVVLVVLGTAYFLYSYIKERKIYQLLFVIWIPLTLLTYLSKNKVYLVILGVVQLLFFLAVIFFLFRNPNKKRGASYQSMLEKLDSYGREPEAAETEAEAESAPAAVSDGGDSTVTEDAEAEPEPTEKES